MRISILILLMSSAVAMAQPSYRPIIRAGSGIAVTTNSLRDYTISATGGGNGNSGPVQTNWPLSSITNSGQLPDWSKIPTNSFVNSNAVASAAFHSSTDFVSTNETRAVVITNSINKIGGDGSLLTAIPESGVTGLTSNLSGKQASGSYITALTGDISASGPGSASATLANVATAGTSPKVTYNAKGLVTSGTSLLVSDIPTLTLSKISDAGTVASHAVTDFVSTNEARATVVVSLTNASNKIGGDGGLLTGIPESSVTSLVSDLSGKQATGNYLTALTGDISASGPGSASATLASVATPGTSPKVTYNAKGLVTSGTALSVSDIPSLTLSKISDAGSSASHALTDFIATNDTRSGISVSLTNSANKFGGDGSLLTGIPESSVTGLTSDLSSKQATGNYLTALTGDITASGPGSASATLATVATPGTSPKVTFNAKGLVTSGTTLSVGDIPTLTLSKISDAGTVASHAFTDLISTNDTRAGISVSLTNASNKLGGDGSLLTAIPESGVTSLVSDLDGKQASGNYITALTGDITASGPGSVGATLASVATPGTSPKVTFNAKGLVTSGTTLVASDIPTLTLSKISDAGTSASHATTDYISTNDTRAGISVSLTNAANKLGGDGSLLTAIPESAVTSLVSDLASKATLSIVTNHLAGKSYTLVPQATTAFFAPLGNAVTNVATTDTDMQTRQMIGTGFKIVGVRLKCSTTPVSGQTFAATVMTNGVATAEVATISNGSTAANDFTHNPIANALGDSIGVKIVSSATAGSVRFDWDVMFINQ